MDDDEIRTQPDEDVAAVKRTSRAAMGQPDRCLAIGTLSTVVEMVPIVFTAAVAALAPIAPPG